MNYTGKLLMAQPSSKSDFFKESVVMIVDHKDDHGAWGLQINRQLKAFSINKILVEKDIQLEEDRPIYLAGPVEQAAIHLIHTGDCVMSNTVHINSDLCVTSNVTMFREIVAGRGPKKWICTLGMSTWAPEQLEGEMSGRHPWTPEHKWLVTDTPNELLDINHKHMWKHFVNVCVKEATATLF